MALREGRRKKVSWIRRRREDEMPPAGWVAGLANKGACQNTCTPHAPIVHTRRMWSRRTSSPVARSLAQTWTNHNVRPRLTMARLLRSCSARAFPLCCALFACLTVNATTTWIHSYGAEEGDRSFFRGLSLITTSLRLRLRLTSFLRWREMFLPRVLSTCFLFLYGKIEGVTPC